MRPWKTILCPIDFSNSCERVLDVAAHVARSERARLTLLHVTDVPGALSDKVIVAHEGGDHVVFVGRVLRLAEQALAPLLFQGGHYRTLGEVL
jgi:nucleotide-binding universal stress UspA family protein